MHTIFIMIAILVIIAGLLISFIRTRMKKIADVPENESILALTDKNFQHQTSNRLVLVDFWASWCFPCKLMTPVLNEVASELKGNTLVGKVNVEQYQSLARKFGVRNIPTMILLKNGREMGRFVGVKSRDFLLNQIKKAQL